MTTPSTKPGDRFAVIEWPNSGINFFEPRDIQLRELLQGASPATQKLHAGHEGERAVYVLWPDLSIDLVPINELPARMAKLAPPDP